METGSKNRNAWPSTPGLSPDGGSQNAAERAADLLAFWKAVWTAWSGTTLYNSPSARAKSGEECPGTEPVLK